jgi:hypothetical protein
MQPMTFTKAWLGGIAAPILTWLVGVGILSAVMCLQTGLGELQNRTTRAFGRAADESTTPRPRVRRSSAPAAAKKARRRLASRIAGA